MKQLRNKVFDGNGFKRFYWYLYFEILVLLFTDVEVGDNCIFKNFHVKKWEYDAFRFPKFLRKTIEEYKCMAIDLKEPYEKI